ncbi:MAG TPA: HlyD family type I secretion periplasmic adaptor subunit [Herbaspirillum sp.]|uniref:HlyD family type I secretion periplasmic adaptor subunit n=1 Tax=Herbaspirillum sp. TaxID=1890675 RepID=UPI002D26414D|nr:HlyD family type I secretion periplasmic adaptor subunit [Herbaspirillum sp.]HZG22496.1 HlyD family type I secretion periplasmic adaptor subunit [Herbaspirillum sp.]
MSLHHRHQAWGDLGRRYLRVFLHFWRLRHALRSDFYTHQEAEFLPAALALQEAPVSRTLLWTARLLVGIVVFAVAWSVLGKIDIIVSANGKLIPTARTKTIASVDLASVKGLFVSEGQRVEAGDLLIALDSSNSDAERDKAADAVAQARLQAARAAALMEAVQQQRSPELGKVEGVSAAQWASVRSQLQGQYQDVRARLARLDDEIWRYGSALRLATQRARDYQALMTDRTVSQHAWLEREQARIDLQGQLADARNQRAALIAQTQKEAHDSRVEAEKIIEAAQQDQRRAEEHSRLLRLTAPVTGTVQQLSVHTVGGVVPAAQPLMQIVPEDKEVEIEAFLENKDVGFVQIGQDAEVKLDAYDYTKYGTLRARVRQVSRDAIQDDKRGLVYSVRIVLDQRSIVIDGQRVALAPGLASNVEIRTGSRRVIEYLLSPLLRHQREALHER